MHPVLLELWKIKIQSYGFFIGLGFMIALFWGIWKFKKLGLKKERIIDIGFWSMVIGLVASHVLFVITRWEDFSSDPVRILYIWEGGFVFIGGLLGAAAFNIWYIRKYRLPVLKTLDVLAIGVVIAHIFGRIGCFMAGCCHGKPTECWTGLRFYSDFVSPEYQGIPIHPTQLYESFSLTLVLIVLLLVDRKKKFDGQVGMIYLMLYSVVRSIIEIFRGDKIRGFVVEGILSTTQFISIFVFLAGLVIYIYLHQKNKKNGKEK